MQMDNRFFKGLPIFGGALMAGFIGYQYAQRTLIKKTAEIKSSTTPVLPSLPIVNQYHDTSSNIIINQSKLKNLDKLVVYGESDRTKSSCFGL